MSGTTTTPADPLADTQVIEKVCDHISPEAGHRFTSRYCPRCGQLLNQFTPGESACRLGHMSAKANGDLFCRSCGVELAKVCQPYHETGKDSGHNFCPICAEPLNDIGRQLARAKKV